MALGDFTIGFDAGAGPVPVILPLQQLRAITVDQYHGLVEAGILKSGDSVELLEGRIVDKMVIKPRHSYVTDELHARLTAAALADCTIRQQQPVTLAQSEPEPDLCVAKGTRARYLKQHPQAADIALVIEVADSSLSIDQSWKQRIYSEAAIPHYWIANLIENCLECYSKPLSQSERSSYQNRVVYQRGESVTLTLEGQELHIAVDEQLFPRE